MPQDRRSHLSAHAPTEAQRAWAMHLRARAAIEPLIRACAREGIPLLPVKGVVTGPLLYADVSERPMLDADLRVAPRHYRRACAIALREGYTLDHKLIAYRSAIFFWKGTQVDLETSVGPPGLCGLTVDAMLQRARPSDLLGFPHLVPELHDHALLLCVNVFKDKLALALPAPMEDARRVARHPSFDARAFARRAQETGSATLAWVVADYLAEVEGDQGWLCVRDALGAPPRPRVARRLAALERSERGTPGSPGAFELRVRSRLASDTRRVRGEGATRMALWTVERRLKGR